MAIPIAAEDSAVDCYAITPSDSLDLTYPVRAIRVSGAGNVVIETPRSREIDGVSRLRTLAFLAGETRIVRALKVWATNTTATGIEGSV